MERVKRTHAIIPCWLVVILGMLAAARCAFADLQINDTNSIGLTESVQPGWRSGREGQRADTYDFGDSYSYCGAPIPLLRVTGAVAAGFEKSASREQILNSLLSEGGVLAGFSVRANLGAEGVLLQAPGHPLPAVSAEQTEAALADVAATQGVAWTAPVFLNSDSGLLQVAGTELVIKLEPEGELQSVLGEDVIDTRRLGGTKDRWVLTLSAAGQGLLQAAEVYAGKVGVVWAEPNFYNEVSKSEVDPLYGDQWYLNNTGQHSAASDADVDAPEAWASTAPSGDIVIAILDDGVETDHPDLSMWVNAYEDQGESGTDDDGNGWDDDVNGYDFYDNDGDPNPSHADDNHGTAVAGIAAAIGGNEGEGGKGISYGSKIMALKMAEGSGYVSHSLLAEAISYAAGFTKNGEDTWDSADVLNFSWNWSSSQTVKDSLDDAHTKGRGGRGLPAFMAAGNSASGYARYTLTGFSTGNWVVRWYYVKNASDVGNVGNDTVWLSYVEFPDGSVERFTSSGMPSGWSTGGDASWTIVDDPSHAYGTGRYEARAGTIGNSEATYIQSSSISVSGSGSLVFRAWVSSEYGWDKMKVYVSNN